MPEGLNALVRANYLEQLGPNSWRTTESYGEPSIEMHHLGLLNVLWDIQSREIDEHGYVSSSSRPIVQAGAEAGPHWQNLANILSADLGRHFNEGSP
jgi:hypothetical protein